MSHFPDCSIYHMPQRSDEWHEARKGILTASELGEWIMEEPKVRLTIAELKPLLDEAGIEYKKTAKRDELVALLPNPEKYATITRGAEDARMSVIYTLLSREGGYWEEETFISQSMQRGIDLEPIAAKAFEEETGNELTHVGFCKADSGHFGCSPDGLIMATGEGLETKAPSGRVHWRYLDEGVLPEAYKMQVEMSMAVTGASAWWFHSYLPKSPPFILKVERTDYTERLLDNLRHFSEELDSMRERFSAIYNEWKNKDHE